MSEEAARDNETPALLAKPVSADSQILPFADAPNIVRAHQKDSYIETILRTKIQDALQVATGQRFIHTHPEEITIFAKALYLALTTALGSRTLGEEYTDLIYVTRDGKKIPKLKRRLGFILAYTLLPYIISRLSKKQYDLSEDEQSSVDGKKSWRFLFMNLSYSRVLDFTTNIHLALFYLSGKYYQLSKRAFGLRYAFGHKVEKNEASNGAYDLLGGIIIMQMLFKIIAKLIRHKQNSIQEKTESQHSLDGTSKNLITKVPNIDESDNLDLSDPEILKYIPEDSRKCMLCLSYMINPSCAPCGHVFCWSCILDWSREHPECPLCRQVLVEQSLLPLR